MVSNARRGHPGDRREDIRLTGIVRMCRALAYLGQPVPVEYLLYGSDSSLVNQVFHPKLLSMLNLAGFGMVAWDRESLEPDVPWQYHSTKLPVFDQNLRSVSRKIRCNSLLAHIRGVPLNSSAAISEQNLHPFVFPEVSLTMAHNGDLYDFSVMRYALIPHIRDEFLQRLSGNTDSEWLYALLMSRFDDPAALHSAADIADAVQHMLNILREVRKGHGIEISSSVNLFISNPNCIVAVRFTFDYGCYPLLEQGEVHQGCVDYLSLWFTRGSDYACHGGEWKMVGGRDAADAVIVASEPLSLDTSTWVEVPEYHLLAVEKHGNKIDTKLIALE